MNLPVLGISGYSGAGKTTLIEALLPRLTDRGLRVGVIKHDAHGLDVDRAGKDSDRLFRAGGDVLVRGPDESLLRLHAGDVADLSAVLAAMIPDHDLVLVEGHKAVPLPTRIWLRRSADDRCPATVPGALLDLDRDGDRVAAVLGAIDAWLPRTWLQTPVYAGVLIGGESRRMGEPKHLIRDSGRTWLEQTVATVRPHVTEVVLLGGGTVPEALAGMPRLPDVPGLGGPLAGMLAAMRWAPLVSWVFLACDLPRLSGAAVQWLLSTREPGTWATLPVLPERRGPEPLLAHYDFRARTLLEGRKGPAELAGLPKVAMPTPPADVATAWTNVNTPGDRQALGQRA